MEQTVEGKSIHRRFDLESHLQPFRNNSKFNRDKLSGIHEILTSLEYSKFINSVYDFFYNEASHLQGSSSICEYQAVSEVIDDFWNDLLGHDFIEKLCFKFK
jgi:hypothetical protein